jgi:glycosyltransferase involved in cell wall biosynthesis
MEFGTQTFAFDVVVIQEMIQPGENGLLAPKESAVQLSNCMASILFNTIERERMQVCCRRTVVEKYSLRTQALAYLSIFDRLITTKHLSARATERPRCANTIV